jgi:hypothetical protein
MESDECNLSIIHNIVWNFLRHLKAEGRLSMSANGPVEVFIISAPCLGKMRQPAPSGVSSQCLPYVNLPVLRVGDHIDECHPSSLLPQLMMVNDPQTPLVKIVPLNVIVKDVPAVRAVMALPPMSVDSVLLQVVLSFVPSVSSG